MLLSDPLMFFVYAPKAELKVNMADTGLDKILHKTFFFFLFTLVCVWGRYWDNYTLLMRDLHFLRDSMRMIFETVHIDNLQ